MVKGYTNTNFEQLSFLKWMFGGYSDDIVEMTDRAKMMCFNES